MGVFTLMSIVGAAVAVVMKERAKQLYVTCGVLFSAGVLLAGGFVHLISDSDDDFQEFWHSPMQSGARDLSDMDSFRDCSHYCLQK